MAINIKDLKVGDKVKVNWFEGYGRYGGCYFRKVVRYVKEVGKDYIIVNCKPDFSGKTNTKIKEHSNNEILEIIKEEK